MRRVSSLGNCDDAGIEIFLLLPLPLLLLLLLLLVGPCSVFHVRSPVDVDVLQLSESSPPPPKGRPVLGLPFFAMFANRF